MIKIGFKLFIITAIAASALGLTNAATATRIEKQAETARIEAKSQVLPLALEFEELAVEEYIELNPMILEVHEGTAEGKRKGYTFRILSEGFAEIELYVGIDTSGLISGVNVLNHRETPGLGTRAVAAAYTGQFTGMSAKNIFDLVNVTPEEHEIQAVSGATVSSRAIVDAVNAAIEFYDVLLLEGEINQ